MDCKRVIRQPRGPPVEVEEGQKNWRNSSEMMMNEQSFCSVDENMNKTANEQVRKSSISSAYGAESPVGDKSFTGLNDDVFGPSEELVYVTHIESPSLFWGQLADDETQEKVKEVTEKLQVFCGNRPLLQGAPILRKIYGGIYTGDDLWYRCKILENLNDNKVKVHFVDFGNEEIISQREVVCLSHELYSHPPFARQYKLNEVNDPKDPNSELFIKGVEHLSHLVADKNFIAKRRNGACKAPTNACPVDLICLQDNTNINQEIISAGFSLEVLEEKPLQPKPIPNKPETISSYQSPITSNNQRAFIASSDYSTPLRKPKDTQDLKLQELEESIKNQSKTIDTLKQMCRQLEESKKLELNDKEKKFRDQLEESNNQLNNAVSNKVGQLVSKVHSLRKIRKESKDNRNSVLKCIQDSLQLLQEQIKMDLDRFEELNKVKEMENFHSDLQDKIRHCSEKDLLPGLVDERNKFRQDLNQAITTFTSSVENLQLDLVKVNLEVALTSLYLNVGDSSRMAVNTSSTPRLEVVEEYKAFQTKKDEDLKEMNMLVNEKCSMLIDVHSNIMRVLNLNEEVESIESCAAGIAELDNIMGVLEALTQEEIAKTKCSEAEENLRAKAVAALISELQSQLACVQELRKTLEYYTKLQQNIRRSLDEKPDIQQGLAGKKKIKKQTTVLKRKLLDETELKETEDVTEEELQKLKEELNCLYLELHRTFVEEDTIINNLANLSKEDFPELLLQYPELEISLCLKTNGLVKSGRALEQYPLEELESGVFTSFFCEKKCVIKEYFFRDAASKDLFQNQAVGFHGCVHKQLISLEAVFYNKNGRIGYLQVPYYEPLQEWLKTEPQPESKKMIMKDILEGLEELHSCNIVHGSISYDAVFVSCGDDERPRGILGHYDLTEELDSRVLQTTKKLKLPKEFSSSTPKFDLICLGQLMASLIIADWNPSVSLMDLNQLTQDVGLISVLEGLLSDKETSIVTAKDALTMTYFEESTVQNGHVSPVDEELD
ncbi:serine/threonine-protein kinase 31-like [Actinia tenebrosa]|uniref:Serine/threonine-protein kinase 31-like n=1 Tax=Actinia tenebrosa TaxID=6105 RepID=A0A6P8I296_ACTTE|nr:serine/threonine-protein kinase 31-like [Actinia tenebrosa]